MVSTNDNIARQLSKMIFLSGYIYGLVEAEAGYIGGLDGCGMVRLVFGEGDGEVLNAVCHADL